VLREDVQIKTERVIKIFALKVFNENRKIY